ncbi:putative NAD(P)/FAD-binding protein YdhS [Rhizobium sp. BK650]|uniref:FAD/NAD(P)-binding protein n=1 Tax=Rhizobium sp. BK650 TaxID=2586990 RepID=UPI0016147103|nr:FAD/NAD(P)-binding protein [Rhizobium sp. BK650]MBB3656204.1 putative NAD(P)/FAD-binding protein YdhS [Rhizobium sp. BK650]
MQSQIKPSTEQKSQRPVVAIIGGGVSGGGVAYHLSKLTGGGAPEIVVFEPRPMLGRGLAYDSADSAHRINVPAAKMSLQPDDVEEFQRWIKANDAVRDDPEAAHENGQLFPRRRVFGDYVGSLLQPFLKSGAITHRRATVTAVRRVHDGWVILDDKGGLTQADIVAIATSHPPPAALGRLAASLAGHPRLIADTTKPGALEVVRPQDRVLVIGNGLTAADVIASLARNGHEGPVVAISRRGLRSRGHAAAPQEAFGDFIAEPATSATELLRKVRLTIRQAAEQGLSWHAVIDQVRSQGHELWRALPIAERRRIVRHLRPYWDVHRFRIAPQVEAVLDTAIEAGRLEILAASVADAKVEGEAIRVILQPRHARGRLERIVDAVIVTTGPAHGGILETQPWLGELAREGYLALDPTGLGLACSERSEALGPDGQVISSLLISGPLARGTFGELMGLPQITEHTVFIAREITEKLKDAERHNSRPISGRSVVL